LVSLLVAGDGVGDVCVGPLWVKGLRGFHQYHGSIENKQVTKGR